MDASEATLPDKSDAHSSFRKPSTDAANRKYRRHSPVKESDSSSADGSPKREQSQSQLDLRKDRSRISDDQRKKDLERESERGLNNDQFGRGYDSRISERQSHGSSRDLRRYDDYSRHHKYEGDKNYQRPSRSGRESRHDGRFEYTKSSRLSDRTGFGSRQVGSSRDSDRYREQDRHRDRDSYSDRRDHHRSTGDHPSDRVVSSEELKGHGKDVSRVTDGCAHRSRGNEKSSYKDVDGHDDQIQKRKRDDWEGDKGKDKYVKERDKGIHSESRNISTVQETEGRNDKCLDKTSKFSYMEELSSTKPTSDHLKIGNAIEKNSSLDKYITENVNAEVKSSTNNVGSANSVDAAKIAALKAAELVNKNLIGFGGVGCLSADQKKKQLWGNKKNTSTEEVSNRWDLNAFDRERQEKFNKLMGVKGNAATESRSSHEEAKKREELDMDLEKQYTAGLRRRDGRTVGLGL